MEGFGAAPDAESRANPEFDLVTAAAVPPPTWAKERLQPPKGQAS